MTPRGALLSSFPYLCLSSTRLSCPSRSRASSHAAKAAMEVDAALPLTRKKPSGGSAKEGMRERRTGGVGRDPDHDAPQR
eukprot:scaffold313934_cov27-Tisochrysis_lutea.AAC.1